MKKFLIVVGILFFGLIAYCFVLNSKENEFIKNEINAIESNEYMLRQLNQKNEKGWNFKGDWFILMADIEGGSYEKQYIIFYYLDNGSYIYTKIDVNKVRFVITDTKTPYVKFKYLRVCKENLSQINNYIDYCTIYCNELVFPDKINSCFNEICN